MAEREFDIELLRPFVNQTFVNPEQFWRDLKGQDARKFVNTSVLTKHLTDEEKECLAGGLDTIFVYHPGDEPAQKLFLTLTSFGICMQKEEIVNDFVKSLGLSPSDPS